MGLSDKIKTGEIVQMVARGASWSLVLVMASSAIGFGTQVLLARLLGTSDYGWYAYLLAWIQVLLIFSRLGFDSAIVKYAAQYHSNGSWSLLRGVLQQSFLIVGIGSALVSMLTYVLITNIDVGIPDEIMPAAKLAIILIPLLSLSVLRHEALRGLKRIVRAQFPEQVLRPALLGVLLVAVGLVLEREVTLVSAIVLNLVCAAAAFMLGAYWLRKALPRELYTTAPEFQTGEWLSVAAPMLLMSAMYMVLGRTDLITLGLLSEASDVGVYSAANTISTVAMFGMSAANSIAAPLISEYYSKNDHASLQHVATVASQGILTFAILVSAALLLLGETFLGWFGSEFVVGYSALAILLVGIVVSSFAGSVGFIMVLTGHQRQAAAIISVVAVANVFANLILIPKYGIAGAAVATAVTTSSGALAMLAYVIVKCGINPTPFGVGVINLQLGGRS